MMFVIGEDNMEILHSLLYWIGLAILAGWAIYQTAKDIYSS